MRVLCQYSLACLVALLLGGAAFADEPVSLTGRSPYFGAMTGTFAATRRGEDVDVSFTASFRDGTSWALQGTGRIRRGTLVCDLFPAVGISGAVAGEKKKKTHKLTIHRDGSRYWGSCSSKKGTTWFREALSMTAGDPAPDTTKGDSKARLKAAVRVLRRVDANGDGLISGRRYGNELDATKDPLARAVFEFVDYGNYTGQTSVYGPATRGDVQEGGLGLGYTTRPTHYTSNQVLHEDALDLGMRDLGRWLSSGPDDLPQQDLERVRAQAKAKGLLSGDATAQYRAIHEAAERLLDHIAKKTGEKERAKSKDGVRLTHAELIAGLDGKSLEALLAKTVIGDGAKEQWMDFFRRGLSYTRYDERKEERGLVGSMLQHYLLVIGKRAMQTSLVTKIRGHLPK
ncbi:MAG: hypothetical protein JKY65_31660 [Planctomycetes bacterium]|nr:hypothetical protein [Planctomycetota bacterium]